MVLSDQRTPYSIMYVWAVFEAKSPPTRQDLVTLLIITHCNPRASLGFKRVGDEFSNNFYTVKYLK
jgi:hypothetical protein